MGSGFFVLRRPSERAEQENMTSSGDDFNDNNDDEIESNDDGYWTAFDEAEVKTNKEAFEMLRQDPNFSEFFSFSFPDMKVRKKIGEGAQAEIYEGEFTMMQKKFPCVLQVFRGDLNALLQQLPRDMLKGGSSVFPGISSGTSSILGGLVLEGGNFDGVFTIVLRREWGDLRKLIDLRMKQLQNKGPPFFRSMCQKDDVGNCSGDAAITQSWHCAQRPEIT